MSGIFGRLSQLNGINSKDYKVLVIEKIRKRYSVNDELAVLRQRDEKPGEFEEYSAYVEKCKAEAKREADG